MLGYELSGTDQVRFDERRIFQYSGVGVCCRRGFPERSEGFKLPVLKLMDIVVYMLLYADALQQMYSSTIVREKKKGEM